MTKLGAQIKSVFGNKFSFKAISQGISLSIYYSKYFQCNTSNEK
jgi:hypothetical protein